MHNPDDSLLTVWFWCSFNAPPSVYLLHVPIRSEWSCSQPISFADNAPTTNKRSRLAELIILYRSVQPCVICDFAPSGDPLLCLLTTFFVSWAARQSSSRFCICCFVSANVNLSHFSDRFALAGQAKRVSQVSCSASQRWLPFYSKRSQLAQPASQLALLTPLFKT